MEARILGDLKLYLALARNYPGRVSRVELFRWFLPWCASFREGRSTIADQRIWIVFSARRFLDRVLRPGMRVFEYGAGGSTLYFLRQGCQVTSVEHHPQWYRSVSDEIARRKYKQWRGFLHEADGQPWRAGPGELVPGGYQSEFGEYTGRTFKQYVCAIADCPDGAFDLVLVDGRARASCLFHARAP